MLFDTFVILITLPLDINFYIFFFKYGSLELHSIFSIKLKNVSGQEIGSVLRHQKGKNKI